MKHSGKKIKRILITVLIFILVVCAGFAWFMTQAYHASDIALARFEQSQRIESNPNEYDFGDSHNTSGIILYPGASVPYEAYAPLAQAIANEGYFVAVVQMPLNFAMLGIDNASVVMNRHPEITTWYIGGHSLGGVCAADFADKHTDKISGVILLAAYSSVDISNTNLRVLSIRGSNDGVLDMDQYRNSSKNLPANFTEHIIEGGNHAQYGSYGEQAGDGIASISPEEQWTKTAEAIRQFIG